MHGEDYICLGFLFGEKSRVAYISDVSRIPESTEYGTIWITCMLGHMLFFNAISQSWTISVLRDNLSICFIIYVALLLIYCLKNMTWHVVIQSYHHCCNLGRTSSFLDSQNIFNSRRQVLCLRCLYITRKLSVDL